MRGGLGIFLLIRMHSSLFYITTATEKRIG